MSSPKRKSILAIVPINSVLPTALQWRRLISRCQADFGVANHSIPRIHLGVYLTSGQETVQAVRWALDAGYRGFDSAQMYRNEREVGKSIRSWLSDETSNTEKLTREDIFFTSKLASNTNYEAARKSITQSVKTSGLGYIGLFLLHSPYGGKNSRLASWKAVEDAI
jgi:diketogulonate reductase-like aldo/keto reductase